MSVHDLDPVIRRLDSGDKDEAEDGVRFEIPSRSGRWRWSKPRYMLVRNHLLPDAEAVSEVTVTIEDFERGWRCELVIAFKIFCPEGHEKKVANALSGGLRPQAQLEQRLRSWAAEFAISHHAEFLKDFYATLDKLSKAVQTRAREETGLALASRVRPVEPDLEFMSPEPIEFRSRLEDWSGQVEVTLDAELRIEDGEEVQAFSRSLEGEAKWRTRLRKLAKKYLETKVPVQRFFESASPDVRDGLQEHLNKRLVGSGFRLARLQLKGEIPDIKLDKVARYHHEFETPLLEYPEAKVICDVLLRLLDIRLYLEGRRKDVKAWWKETIVRATEECLFGVSYLDLCRNLAQKKEAIEERMEDEAAKIGFKIEQLTTITDLPVDELTRPFDLDIEDDEYPSISSEVKLGLGTHVTLRIRDPIAVESISNLLSHRKDVQAHIREEIRRQLRRKLHNISPANFYMDFDSPRSERSGASLREELGHLVQDTLRKQFKAEVLNVSCKMIKTQLVTLIRRLCSTPLELTFRVDRHRGEPSLDFTGRLRVGNILPEGWPVFLATRPSSDEIEEALVGQLQQVLADWPLKDLLTTTNQEMQVRINEWCQERAAAEFGLRVGLLEWRRLPTKEDREKSHALLTDGERQVQADLEHAARARKLELESVTVLQDEFDLLRSTLKNLRTRRARLLTGEDPEECADLEAEIAEHEQQLESLKSRLEDRREVTTRDLSQGRLALQSGATLSLPQGEETLEETASQGPDKAL